MGIHAEEVGDATRVVAMPVGEEHVGERDVEIGEGGGNQVGPFFVALGGVEEHSLGAGSNEIRVCSLEGEFAGILTEDANAAGAEDFDVWDGGQARELCVEVVFEGADVEGLVDLLVAAFVLVLVVSLVDGLGLCVWRHVEGGSELRVSVM